MEKHKELKKTLIDYTIVTSFDYIRTFDENNFTDFSFNKVSTIVNNESKYLLVGLSRIDGNPFVLYNPKLDFIHDELYQNMVYTNKVKGYNKERNRVLGYYEGDGIVRFGNKYPETIKIQFELATVDEIIRKNYYISNLPNKTRHEIIQSYILNLGESLGYKVNIAINDKKKLKRLNTNLLIAKTPQPADLVTISSNKVIDRIDVIWYENIIPVAAFEIEFSNNYADAFRRLHKLNEYSITLNPHLYNIICSYDQKYYEIYNYCKENYSFIKSLFPKLNLYFLPLSKLDDSLKLKDVLGFGKEKDICRNHFFSIKSLTPLIANFHLFHYQ
ncbi:hypothetical protein [Clostridium omnivorum]|uniref:Uncharacterized protein n=1 Tax=Clostridium omnivorum TaxID=1604902 RepID=A0ABQ5N7B3_9CLOT|nr:hypothetical protein [Clostridium sp. E14]GLC31124.1 hypothetical protein bsdE14_25340 [Clostridium sp. E14]